MDVSDKASRLMSVINKVKSVTLMPSVYMYSISKNDTGFSAVDIDECSAHVAYSPGHSQDVYMHSQDYSEDYFAANLADPWLKHIRKPKTVEECKAKKMHVFRNPATVTGLHFTSDGNLLMSCCLDGTVSAFSVNSFKYVETYLETFGACSDIHTSKYATYFATSFRLWGQSGNLVPHSANLYKFDNRYPVTTFKGHNDDVECVRFHPSIKYLATASRDKTIKMWSIDSFLDVRCFINSDPCEEYPKKLAFSPDGQYLAAASSGSVKIWDLQASKVVKTLKISNSNPNMLNICYDASGKLLATGGSEKILQIWDAKNVNNEPENDCMKSDTLNKKIYGINYTINFFSCVTG